MGNIARMQELGGQMWWGITQIILILIQGKHMSMLAWSSMSFRLMIGDECIQHLWSCLQYFLFITQWALWIVSYYRLQTILQIGKCLLRHPKHDGLNAFCQKKVILPKMWAPKCRNSVEMRMIDSYSTQIGFPKIPSRFCSCMDGWKCII